MRTIRGRVASVKWAYFTAAAVEGYTVTHDAATGWAVAGSLVPGLVDAYKLAQRPLFFVAPFKRGAWRWEIHTITRRDGGRFVAALGPMSVEGEHGITCPTP
jgi:hypothetical protein